MKSLRNVFFTAVVFLTGFQLNSFLTVNNVVKISLSGNDIFGDVEIEHKKRQLQEDRRQFLQPQRKKTGVHQQIIEMYPLRDLSNFTINDTGDDPDRQTFRPISTKVSMKDAGCFFFRCDHNVTTCNNKLPTNYDGPEPPCCTHVLRDMAQAFDKEMSRLGLDYVTGWGTLLGLRREDMIIPWTADNDYIIPSAEVASAMVSLWDTKTTGLAHIFQDINRMCVTETFAGGKLKSKWRSSVDPDTIIWKSETPYIDFYLGRKPEEDLFQEFEFKCVHLYDDVFPTKRTLVYDGTFPQNMPANPDVLLQSYYGRDWKTPLSNKNPHGDENIECQKNRPVIAYYKRHGLKRKPKPKP